MRPAPCVLAAFLLASAPAGAASFAGVVLDAADEPIAGARVSISYGEPIRALTVYTDDAGRFATPSLPERDAYDLRVRRIGWRDLRRSEVGPQEGRALRLVLAREDDPAALAAQLPSNRWLSLLLARIEDEAQREEFVRQCTYCHQQGNAATRLRREDWQWEKVLRLMARMGATLSPELREQIPALFDAAFDPETAVPALTAAMHEPDFAPPPDARARGAVVEEWELGERASMQHDLVVHPDGRVFSVDMMQDQLYVLDPSQPGVAAKSYPVPSEGLALGGIFGGGQSPAAPSSNARQGPHSLQVAPDGAVWTTLALGNRLGRFDPRTEEWSLHELPEGFYPHTLRFDAEGRIWFTIAASNHLAMFDPATAEFRTVRLPARTFGQAVALRLLPVLLWLSQRVDLMAEGGGGGMVLPVPYGVDVAPDGGVWFSQLNEHRIGRLDPETFEYEMIDTPFSAPRRLRFDGRGRLWIPGFSSSLVARFDPETRAFESFPLPIEPAGTETPYALNVHRESDTVWICGTNSDTLIRFDPDAEAFTVYPLPTRVTYTREIDFDAAGRVWTSNSNLPTWQVEGGFPRVLRLDPREAAPRAGTDPGRNAS